MKVGEKPAFDPKLFLAKVGAGKQNRVAQTANRLLSGRSC
jgi:hypothetical protein